MEESEVNMEGQIYMCVCVCTCAYCFVGGVGGWII